MNILAVLSQKGGTGKSTLVHSLAVAGPLDKCKVAIIDADPQGTVVAWGKRREHKVPHIVALGSSTIASQIEALKGRGPTLSSSIRRLTPNASSIWQRRPLPAG